MLDGRLEILAEGQEIDPGDAQIIHHLHHLGAAFAEAEHQAGFGENLWIMGFYPVEQAERLVIARAGADRGIESRHGFKIVVEDIRARRRDQAPRRALAQEIGGQHLDRGVRRAGANGADHGGEMRRAAIGEIVAIDRGDDDMAEPEPHDRVRDPRRLIAIERPRLAGADMAKAAGAGAGIAHDHHGGVADRPAFADIRAGGLLAHRVQAVFGQQRAGLVIDRMGRRLDPDPGGFARDRVVRPVGFLGVARAGRGNRATPPMIDQNAHGSRLCSSPRRAEGVRPRNNRLPRSSQRGRGQGWRLMRHIMLEKHARVV